MVCENVPRKRQFVDGHLARINEHYCILLFGAFSARLTTIINKNTQPHTGGSSTDGYAVSWLAAQHGRQPEVGSTGSSATEKWLRVILY